MISHLVCSSYLDLCKHHHGSLADHEHLDFETRIKYHLPLEGETSTHDLSTNVVSCYDPSAHAEPSNEEPDDLKIIPTAPIKPESKCGRRRALNAEQRALVRILSRTKQIPTRRLAAHFGVSMAIIKKARYNDVSPKDDITQGMSYLILSRSFKV